MGPKLVHSAGASESGKTTPRSRISAKFLRKEATVIELDDYLQPNYTDARKLLCSSRESPEYKTEWIMYLTRKFEKDLLEHSRKKVIVFVELLDQMGPI